MFITYSSQTGADEEKKTMTIIFKSEKKLTSGL